MKLTGNQLIDFFTYHKNLGCYFPPDGYILIEMASESPIIILTIEDDGVAEIMTDNDYRVKLTGTIEVDIYKKTECLPQ